MYSLLACSLGRGLFDLPSLWQRLNQALRNISRPGLGLMALSAVDQALTVVNLTPAVDGYAQILRAAANITLLSLHLDGALLPHARVARIYFAVADGNKLLFASTDARAAAARFEKVRRDQPADQVENFINTQPTALPHFRGQSFRELVSQLSTHLLESKNV